MTSPGTMAEKYGPQTPGMYAGCLLTAMWQEEVPHIRPSLFSTLTLHEDKSLGLQISIPIPRIENGFTFPHATQKYSYYISDINSYWHGKITLTKQLPPACASMSEVPTGVPGSKPSSSAADTLKPFPTAYQQIRRVNTNFLVTLKLSSSYLCITAVLCIHVTIVYDSAWNLYEDDKYSLRPLLVLPLPPRV